MKPYPKNQETCRPRNPASPIGATAIAWFVATVLIVQVAIEFVFGGWKQAWKWSRSVEVGVHERERIEPETDSPVSGVVVEIGMDNPIQPDTKSAVNVGPHENAPGQAKGLGRNQIERQTRYYRGVVVVDLKRQLSELDALQDQLPQQTYDFRREKIASALTAVEQRIAANEAALVEVLSHRTAHIDK